MANDAALELFFALSQADGNVMSSKGPTVLPVHIPVFLGNGCHIVDVITLKVFAQFADGDTTIFAGVNHILVMTVYCVVCSDGTPLVGNL